MYTIEDLNREIDTEFERLKTANITPINADTVAWAIVNNHPVSGRDADVMRYCAFETTKREVAKRMGIEEPHEDEYPDDPELLKAMGAACLAHAVELEQYMQQRLAKEYGGKVQSTGLLGIDTEVALTINK